MQTISVYLYPNRINAFSSAFAPTTVERYRQVYNRNLKIYRGSDNRVELRILNADQKPRSIAGLTIVFNLISRDTQELVLKKDCVLQSAEDGRVYFTLSEKELRSIEKGFYQYSIVGETRTTIDNQTYQVNSRVPLYTDSQYGVNATIEVLGDVDGVPTASTEIDVFGPKIDWESGITTYTSTAISAQPETSSPQTNHTFQIYLSNFSGQIKIQGSLEVGGDPFVWTDIETLNYVNQNSVFRNIVGKWNYFRIYYVPKKNTNSVVDKVVYR